MIKDPCEKVKSMPKTFENQDKLPRLPIPDLDHTLKVYLKSLLPYLSPSEISKMEQIANDFKHGLGLELQQRLIQVDKQKKYSWLEDWWYDYAYLGWRSSVLVNSNWYVLAQPYLNKDIQIQFKQGYTDIQVTRACGFTSSFLDYKEMIETEQLPADQTKQGPLDMHQFQRLFGITRVPKPKVDVIVGQFPCLSKHIIVLLQDQIFVVYVYTEDGKRLKLADLKRQFQECIRRVESGKKMQPPIGILGGQDRDQWALDHGYLLDLDKKNQESFRWIETAIFAVSLDHRLVGSDVSEIAKNVFHGFDGHNRWSDKSLNIVVTNDGRLGVHGEHSPCDALVPAQLVDFAVQREPAQDPVNASDKPRIAPIQRLEWVIDDTITKSLERAQSFIHDLIADSDVRVLHYKTYGNEFIKKVAKVSPDAFAQMCLQVAFYRMHGYTCGVYETSSTRKYLHGRTETCRSHTIEQKEFVEIFESEKSAQEKYKAFQKACKAHVAFLQMAGNGMGCDRHLLGLKLCLREGESHELFTHASFGQSSKWQLSTSGLFSGERLIGTGFDGYGMNYMLGKNIIKIGVESKYSCKETSTLGYTNTLSKVFDDIKVMCESINGLQPKL